MKKKKNTASTKIRAPRGSSANFALLIKSGVVIDHERITVAERKVIDSLSQEEVDALVSVYEKFSSAQKVKGPFWRAFCF